MRVFISYNRKDESFARDLHERLHAWGHDAWLDVFDIPAGAYWPDAIDAGLRESQVVIGLLAPESVASRNVRNEWDWAINNKIPLIPLRLREVPAHDMPHRYTSINYIDSIPDRAAALDRLRSALDNPAGYVQHNGHPKRAATRSRALTNRDRMLQKVRAFWVEGVLEKSLHGELIKLVKDPMPGAVQKPWDSVLQHAGYAEHTLPPDARIVDVFDRLDGALLILGDPGAGKTTTLLELARDLIDAAQHNDSEPVPVVFNLSSWANEQKPLADWLVDELNTKYDIPRKIAQGWVDADALLLLLDGLDEVKADCRTACVEAINAYRGDHGLVDMAVCSRIAEYEALQDQLRLHGAILLRALTPEQIDAYLHRGGAELAALREAMNRSSDLRELAQTPLVLSIMALAYRGADADALRALESGAGWQTRLFETYVQRMFERGGRTHTALYPREKTIHWLAWLADRMVEHKQPVFYIERLQPWWLPRSMWQLYKHRLKLAVGLLVGLAVGLAMGLAVGLAGGLAMGLAVGLAGGLTMGLAVGLVMGLFIVSMSNQVLGLVGLGHEIKVVETLKRSRRVSNRKWAVGLVVGLATSVSFGVGGGLGAGLAGGTRVGVTIGLIVGPVVGLAAGLGGIFLFIFISSEIETRISPNQGIWRSARTAIYLAGASGLAGALTIGLTVGLAFGLTVRLVAGLASGLTLGTMFGLLFGFGIGLRYGGTTVIQHAVLRYVLHRADLAPLNYAQFLDYCAERVLLRKVGGGYIFVHRMLMEYFAGLDPTRGPETP